MSPAPSGCSPSVALTFGRSRPEGARLRGRPADTTSQEPTPTARAVLCPREHRLGDLGDLGDLGGRASRTAVPARSTSSQAPGGPVVLWGQRHGWDDHRVAPPPH
jgi:hypothetical protein